MIENTGKTLYIQIRDAKNFDYLSSNVVVLDFVNRAIYFQVPVMCMRMELTQHVKGLS